MKIVSPKLKIMFDRCREIRDSAKSLEPGHHGSSTIMAGKQIASRSQELRKSSSKSRGASISGIVAPRNTAPRRSTQPPLSVIVPQNAEKDDDDGDSSSSCGNSDDALGSLWDNAVSDGSRFTDYLSDESEAELQRQAEARAALIAQNQAEELEFRIARQQLGNVALQPPKSWNPTNPPVHRHSG